MRKVMSLKLQKKIIEIVKWYNIRLKCKEYIIEKKRIKKIK